MASRACLWRRRAEQAGERGHCFEQERVDAGLLVGGAAGAELGDRAAVLGLGGELAYPGGDGGVSHWSLTSAAAARAAVSSAMVFRAA